jgi:Ser/Thr protein kinase RdoA (MazF antagonist)
VTLWEHVDHDPARALDGVRAGRALRTIHDVLREVDATVLPHFTRTDETRALLGGLALEGRQREELEAVLDAARVATEDIDADLQPVHGDAHLGNVLRSTGGPVWCDLDKVCLAPRELDLACNEIRTLHRGRQQSDDDLLSGYGAHDRALVSLLVPVHLAALTARTFDLAERRPEFVPLAEQRLRWAVEGLGL